MSLQKFLKQPLTLTTYINAMLQVQSREDVQAICDRYSYAGKECADAMVKISDEQFQQMLELRRHFYLNYFRNPTKLKPEAKALQSIYAPAALMACCANAGKKKLNENKLIKQFNTNYEKKLRVKNRTNQRPNSGSSGGSGKAVGGTDNP